MQWLLHVGTFYNFLQSNLLYYFSNSKNIIKPNIIKALHPCETNNNALLAPLSLFTWFITQFIWQNCFHLGNHSKNVALMGENYIGHKREKLPKRSASYKSFPLFYVNWIGIAGIEQQRRMNLVIALFDGNCAFDLERNMRLGDICKAIKVFTCFG